jgi:hypothetical protein
MTEVITLHEHNELQIGDLVGDTERMVIASTKLNERVLGDCYASWIVVAVKIGEYHPYAVWVVVATPKGFVAQQGDYFFEIGDAVKRYQERGGK